MNPKTTNDQCAHATSALLSYDGEVSNLPIVSAILADITEDTKQQLVREAICARLRRGKRDRTRGNPVDGFFHAAQSLLPASIAHAWTDKLFAQYGIDARTYTLRRGLPDCASSFFQQGVIPDMR